MRFSTSKLLFCLAVSITILFSDCTEDDDPCSSINNASIEIEVIETPSDDLANGSIKVIISGSEQAIEYSLDGEEFQESDHITNIGFGLLTIYAQNESGCQISAEFNISQNFTLSVINGSGGGVYAEGEHIDIQADSADIGQKFTNWSGDIEFMNDPANPVTSLTMPAQPLTISAEYEKIRYNLTLSGGSGSGEYTYDSLVTISANPPQTNQEFRGWSGDTFTLTDSTSSETTLTMPATDISLSATYGPKRYQLIVLNGDGSGLYEIGTEVEISAIDNRLFEGWSGDTLSLIDPSAPTAKITISSDLTLKAKYGDITFSGDLMPTFEQSCGRCHSHEYEYISDNAALVVEVLSNCTMPLIGACVSDEKIDLIKQWIDKGMPNN